MSERRAAGRAARRWRAGTGRSRTGHGAAALLHALGAPGVARSPATAGLGALLVVAPLLLSGAVPALAAAPRTALRSATDVGAAWQWPLQPRPAVVRPFAPGPTPYSPGHYGVDLAAAQGQDVQAAGAGRVSYAGLLAGRGVVVVVHGSLRTTYEPVDAAVAVGSQVVRGQRLGAVTTGHACPGACLHWGLRRGDTYLDPLLLLRGPVRLLPRGASGSRRAGVLGPLRVPIALAAPERVGASSLTSSRPHTGAAAARGSTSGPGPASRTADHGRTTSTQDDAGGAARSGPPVAGTSAQAVGGLPVAHGLTAASGLAGLLVTGAVLLLRIRARGARRGTPTRRA